MQKDIALIEIYLLEIILIVFMKIAGCKLHSLDARVLNPQRVGSSNDKIL
jgi:hypothetical protein